MNNYIATFISLVDGAKLLTLFGLITLDLVLGVVLAIRAKTFDFKRLADFLSPVCWLAGGYFIVGAFATIEPTYVLAVVGTWAIINATLIAEIVSKLKKFGVPINSPSSKQ